MKVNIYALKDPASNEIMYVGATTLSLARRLTNHKYFSNKRTSEVNLWLDSLYKRRLEPIMELLEVVSNSGWKARQDSWINKVGKLNIKNQRGGIVLKEERTEESIERSTVNKRKKVICIETNEVFESITEASKENDVTKIVMSKALKGDGKVNGSTFAFYTDKEVKKTIIPIVVNTKKDKDE